MRLWFNATEVTITIFYFFDDQEMDQHPYVEVGVTMC